MELRFLGHAAFDLRLAGARVCVDPHRPGALGGRFALPPIEGPFDAIACSHGHEDHAAWTPALGTTRFIEGGDRIADLHLHTRPAFHDAEGGLRMGIVRMLSLSGGGLRVVHCGDLGAWDDGDLAWLRGVDVLLVPVGGTFTLDGTAAAELVRRVAPRFAVPMHAADPRVDLPLAPVDGFLAAWSGPVACLDVLRVEQGASEPTRVVVMDPP